MDELKRFYGMYLGIVVQNDDPDRAGRIKVWVPHVNASVYDNWVQVNEDKAFKFPGLNIDSDLNIVLEKLKNILPWAECAVPLVGATGTGRYNSHLESASISDTSKLTEFEPDDDYVKTKYSLNNDGIGESPGSKYEKMDMRLKDAFTDGAANDTNHVNVLGNNYVPNTYSNQAKGSFSIPNVGSHVWIFFKEGDPLSPVYFASSYGEQDWQSIYDITDNDRGIDYPGTFENTSKEENQGYSTDTETYRNKFVINQKGGVLEFVNTDNREILKMTHYSGSFKEFNNNANIELASANDNKLVLEDQFETVRGFKNSYVERDYDFIVRGDRFKKIGNLNVGAMAQWRNVMAAVADVKQLFETKRSNSGNWTSPNQSRKGKFGPCPVCNPGSSRSKSYPRIMGTWINVADPVPIVNIEKGHEPNKGKYVEPKVYPPNVMGGGSGGTIFGDPCPACGGSGTSPSSMDGSWSGEEKKQQAQFDRTVLDAVETLVDIERELGLGGNEDIHITKHKIETIGLVMNDFGSIRTDVVGKMFPNEMVVHKQGVFENRKESPLTEYVHVDDLPGGTYTLNVCNKYNVQVGAGGISMKSYGPVDISGTIVNTTGEQVNISSTNEINVDGGKRLSLIADIISIRQRKQDQVLIDSSAGVSRNLIVGGSSLFEGEVYLHHVTAPTEIQETENTTVFAKLLKDLRFEVYANWYNRSHSHGMITLAADSNDDKVRCYDHTHHFKNLPLHLKDSNDDVRNAAKECNGNARGKAKPREWLQATKKSKSFSAAGSSGGMGGGLGAMSSGGGISSVPNMNNFASAAAAAKPVVKQAAANAVQAGAPQVAAGQAMFAAANTLRNGGNLKDAAGAAAGAAKP